MPKLPRDVTQEAAIRALVRCGGEEVYRGKGSHRSVLMPNGYKATLPNGILKVGLLGATIKQVLTVEEFIEKL